MHNPAQDTAISLPPQNHSPHQPETIPDLQTIPLAMGSQWGRGRRVRRGAMGKTSKPGAAQIWPQNRTPTPGLRDIKLSLSSLPNHLQQQKYLSEAIEAESKPEPSSPRATQVRGGGLRQQHGEILSG